MQVLEFNIGLDVKGSLNNIPQIEQRFGRAQALLQAWFGADNVKVSRVDAQYENPESGVLVLERTLVARVRDDGRGSVIGFCHAVCEALEQECIAVYQPRTARGHLVGPEAAAWGDFNPDYFVRYRDAAEDQARAA